MPKLHQRTGAERHVDGGREIELTFREADGPAVPAILQLPAAASAVPAALLIHGFSSSKEVLAHSIGRGLLRHGIASFAIDLPMHGSRSDPAKASSIRNPLEAVAQWRLAISEARSALRYLNALGDVDSTRIALVGYSLGAHVASAVAADEPIVRALVVAAGGDLPEGSAMSGIARAIADPVVAIRRLAGRPLLMVHGRSDRTVRPAQAQRLFDAAGEPKEIRWYDSGHHLPVAGVEHVAAWLAEKLG